jgi:hypothetical protein
MVTAWRGAAATDGGVGGAVDGGVGSVFRSGT